MSDTITAPKLDKDGTAWLYPEAWGPEQRTAWEGIQGRKIAEKRRRDQIAAEMEAAASSPDAMLAAARAEADEEQRQREAAERRAKGEIAWQKAVEAHGDRARRVLGVEGDVFIMQAMSEQEADHANARAMNLAAKADNPTRAHNDFLGAHRDAMLAKFLHPERSRVREQAKKYPGLWADFEAMRDGLIKGRRDDEGKEPAL